MRTSARYTGAGRPTSGRPRTCAALAVQALRASAGERPRRVQARFIARGRESVKVVPGMEGAVKAEMGARRRGGGRGGWARGGGGGGGGRGGRGGGGGRGGAARGGRGGRGGGEDPG